MFTFLRIERPTTRPCGRPRRATSIACCIRWMFEANDATRMRPVRGGMIWRNASPTRRSEPVHARPLGVRRVAEQQVDAAVAELGELADVGLQAVDRRVVELVVARVQDAAAGVSRARPRRRPGSSAPSGRTRRLNGPSWIGSPSGSASRSSAARRRPCSSSFDLIEPERQPRRPDLAARATSRRRYGSAPTWSSWPCVSTTARTARAVAQVREVGEDEVDAEVLVAREREPGVDDDHLAAGLDTRSCSCRPRRGRRAG